MSEPVAPFSAPWEAQVFAMVVALQDSGLFTGAEWADALGAAIRPADGPEALADYGRWLAALETILAARGIADGPALDARRDAFLRAAEATPHGLPIVLENDPLFRQ
ncbi:nitrile hydratase accessory protein [Methylobacterium sp. J-059]|uniref:nitrile hydratase accessory protein n=1 Tax=Methylobacterium sp. J-059 TaxID=2836643 RepID=UPI001FB89987|nr:nitrile hydratase accessory protein [Methylobacterium sp. J-059]MCJ2042598.1 nitrile hydratase accessory protein [Methylobacterium sp. J-059]